METDIFRFVKWRAGLMELAVQKLNLAEATIEIPLNVSPTQIDPYQMIQVHDYLNISFLRPDASVKASTKKTIEVLSTAYPELLREKFFVNVPAIMGWMFAAVKIFVSKETVRKFHPISNGGNLAKELEFGKQIPEIYGGMGNDLEEAGEQLPMAAVPAEEAKPVEVAKVEEPKTEATKAEETVAEKPASELVPEPTATATTEPAAETKPVAVTA